MSSDSFNVHLSEEASGQGVIEAFGNVHLLDMDHYRVKELLDQLNRISVDFQRVYKQLEAYRSQQTEGLFKVLQHFPIEDFNSIDTERMSIIGRLAESIAYEMGLNKSDCQILKYAVPMCDNRTFNFKQRVDLLIKTAIEIVNNIDENYDGTGFPNKLKHEQLPLSSRIATVVYGFYTYVACEPYGFQMSKRAAFESVRKNSGYRYDPLIVESLERVLARIPD